MLPVKTISRKESLELARRQNQTNYCENINCKKVTREGKPFCPVHVDEHPYVRQLISLISKKAAEEAAVLDKGTKAIKSNSITAQEIIACLHQFGTRTVPRLGRDMNLPEDTVAAYVRYLKRKGLVKTKQNARHVTLVELS